MGKKGVILDNGKKAQSSMALYWRKHQQQSKQPKKQYQPTQEEQLDQRVQSGFQKWKLHKEKFISKAYQKKQKPIIQKKQQKSNQIKQQQQEIFIKQEKKKGPVHIPGFKSKQALQQKLRPQYNKQVNQADNVLKLPSHLSDFTQEDILKVLREKKAHQDMIKKKKHIQQKQDVMLGQDFLQSFKQKKQQKPAQQKEETIQKPKEQQFFKSNLLNQISKGNLQGILPPKIDTQEVQKQLRLIQEKIKAQKKIQQDKNVVNHNIRPLFKPRVLHIKK